MLCFQESWRSIPVQPARLLSPGDFQGKNTGMDCHFLLQNGAETTANSYCNWISTWKWWNWAPTSHHTKNISKWIKDQNVYKIKLSEERSKSVNLCDLGLDNGLGKITKAQATKTPHTLVLIKGHYQEIEKTTEWEETLANYVCNKVLVSKIYLTTTTNKR